MSSTAYSGSFSSNRRATAGCTAGTPSSMRAILAWMPPTDTVLNGDDTHTEVRFRITPTGSQLTALRLSKESLRGVCTYGLWSNIRLCALIVCTAHTAHCTVHTVQLLCRSGQVHLGQSGWAPHHFVRRARAVCAALCSTAHASPLPWKAPFPRCSPRSGS